MKRKFNIWPLVLVFLALLTIISLAKITYGWITNFYAYDQEVLGKSGNVYFAGGDGSSSDPFIISEPNHFYNLSYLQDIGAFDNNQYYFKVADPDTGLPITIDFSDSSYVATYRTIYPIGTDANAFIGVFDGNDSTLANFFVNGSGYQDIGVFGYVGSNASISDLFLQNVTIISNPSLSDDTSGYHTHNDGEINVATGYVAGHVCDGSSLSNIFVIDSTITSLSSTADNRTQYGLVGYNESDSGIVKGGPEDVGYSFDLNANNAYAALTTALAQYGSYYVNGTGDTYLTDAVPAPGIPSKLLYIEGIALGHNVPVTYSLSTLKISAIANDPDPVYLYDQMVADGNPIGTEEGHTYNRDNIDLVGLTTFAGSVGAYYFAIDAYARNILTPTEGMTFNATDYPCAILLYVKPMADPNNLGDITATYTGGGDVAYYVGSPGLAPTITAFNASGVAFTLMASDAFCAVQKDEVTETLTVTYTDPDYYVFLLGVTNGQAKVSDISFVYTPPMLNIDSLSALDNIDFINDESDVTGLPPETPYVFSYVNFGYELIETQGLSVNTARQLDGSFVISIVSSISDASAITFNVINLDNYTITLVANGAQIYTGSNDLIEASISMSGSSANGTDLGY